MNLNLKSKTITNFYGNNPDEYTLKFHHFNILVDNDSKVEYKLLDQDIRLIRKINGYDFDNNKTYNSIIYFSDLINFEKVLNNTNVFYDTSDIYLRIRNKEEYELYRKLNIKVNLIINKNDLDSINPSNNDNITIQIDNVSELSLDDIDNLKYNISQVLVGEIMYITNDYVDYLSVLSKQFGIDKNNQKLLEENFRVTNDIYGIGSYKQILSSLNKIIECCYDENQVTMIKNIFDYIASNVHYAYISSSHTDVQNQNLIGPLFKRRAVCEGYSKLLKQLLSLIGVESIIVSSGANKEFGGHVWNQVKIDDTWYNLDVTSQSVSIHNEKYYNYFLVDDNTNNYKNASPFGHKCDECYVVDKKNKTIVLK